LPSPEAIFLHQNTPNPSPGPRTRLHRTIVSQAYIWEGRKARKGETDGRERESGGGERSGDNRERRIALLWNLCQNQSIHKFLGDLSNKQLPQGPRKEKK